MGVIGRRLLVFPDSERVEDALVEAARSHGFVDASCFLTFTQLVQQLAPGLSRRPVSALTARVIVHSAALALGDGPFRSFVREPAFARGALELIFDLKQGLLPPLGFQSAVSSLPSSRQARPRYLAELYRAYEASLAKHGLADREDLVHAALEALRAGGLPQKLRAFSSIELKALHDFPPARRQLVLELARACDSAGVELRVEVPGGGSPSVDAAVDPLFRELETHAQQLRHVEAHKTDFVALGRPLGPLGAELFEADEQAVQVPADALELRTTPSAREEIRLIARRVRKAIAAGTPPERIAIVWRDLATEAEAIEEALDDLSVPARLRRGAPLGSTPAGRSALELPLLVDDGFPAEAVARLLSGRYLPRLGGDEEASASRILAEASVRDDRLGSQNQRGAYDLRLSALAARLNARGRSKRAADVRTLREKCIQLLQICSRIPEEAPAAVMLDRWWTVVEQLGIPAATRVAESAADESSLYGRAVLRMLARDQAATDALGTVARDFADALELAGASKAVINRRTFHRWLQDAAADYNLSPRGPRGGAVRVLDLRELPGRAFDLVFIAGMTDGRIPGRTASNALLPDEDKAGINRHQKREVFRLSSGEFDGKAPHRLAEDRLLFFVGLASATERVVVTAPREAEGREQIVSPFVEELSRRTGIALAHEPLRATPLLEDAANEQQLRERLALEALSPPDLRLSAPEPAIRSQATHLATEPWFREAAALAAIEEERLRFFGSETSPAGPYTGAIKDPLALEALGELFRFDEKRPLAATTLERFGNCAFQGFLSTVLKLEEPEAPGEEQDSRGQGSFWHAVLERLFPVLKEQGLLRKPVAEIPEAIIDKAIDEAVAVAERRDHTGHPTLWRLSRDRARTMVRMLLSADHNGLPFDGHDPVAVELKFGSKGAAKGWEKVVIPAGEGEADIYLEGKIDRLDANGQSAGIVDYKRKSIDKKHDELLATDFQLAVYLYAARQSGYEQVRGLLLSLTSGETKALERVVGKSQTVDDLLDAHPKARERARELGHKNLANAVHGLVNELRSGRFAIRPHECRNCSFKAVCRISERRGLEEDGG